MEPKDAAPWQIAAWYHERTKHSFHAYARSPGRMDWSNQPEPFRRFTGAPLVHLPLPERVATPPYRSLFTPGATEPAALTARSLADFFYHSLAISVWKSYGGETWALRCNPSSGNLHPTEGYALLDAVDGLSDQPAVHHYRADEHALEQRCVLDTPAVKELLREISGGGFLVVLTSIHWREAWKYGERAYRYCQLDTGHAVAALRFAAAICGWRLTVLPAVRDATLATLTGTGRPADYPHGQDEAADLLVLVSTDGLAPDAEELDRISTMLDELADAAANDGSWRGTANRLSQRTRAWRAIDLVHENCGRWDTASPTWPHPGARDCFAEQGDFVFAAAPPEASAGEIIRNRRSAQMMDGETRLSRDAFFSMLARTVPALCAMPWDAQPWPVSIHLGLFVHLVDDLEPGLYCLVRDNRQFAAVRSNVNHSDFLWRQPDGCPADLPLYSLRVGDVREVAASLSCGQDIAGLGIFSLGMFARLMPDLQEQGADLYRRLFWEAGMIGQVLYLEAEYHGVRGTGIGCFFDDPVHSLFGMPVPDWQSLYHFTVGGPLVDERLVTRDAYPPR